jgi:hypothetical protein
MPLLLSSGQVVEALRNGDGILLWFGLLVVMNLGIAILGVLSARPLEEASR